METGPDRLMTREDVKNLVAEVLEQHQQPAVLKDGNALTLSVFSELQFALGSQNLDGTGPVKQRLPAEITTNGFLEFPEATPHWARRIVAVHRGRERDSWLAC
jgi:hypothetical protein